MTGQPTAAEALRALAARFRKRIDDPRYDDDMYKLAMQHAAELAEQEAKMCEENPW